MSLQLEEEFTQHIVGVEPDVNGMEEDSDDEVCEVEDGFVTEDMIAEQDVSFLCLQEILMAGTDTEVDVWSTIVSEIAQPPLRLLRDDIDVEVVDKIPSSEEESFPKMSRLRMSNL